MRHVVARKDYGLYIRFALAYYYGAVHAVAELWRQICDGALSVVRFERLGINVLPVNHHFIVASEAFRACDNKPRAFKLKVDRRVFAADVYVSEL